jgi:hypothetical protein
VPVIVHRECGEFVCLLNNDTVVTEKWLELLTGLLSFSEAHGLAGAMSNYAAAPQLVETVPYRVGPRRGGRPPQAGLLTALERA